MSSINVDYNFKTDDVGVSNNTLQNPIKYFQNNSTTFNKFKGTFWSHNNNKYAKYQDRHPYAENFVRQAYREDCAVLGPIPAQNLGCRASVGADVQTTAQSGPVPFLQIQPQAVKLKKALAHLWVAEMATI